MHVTKQGRRPGGDTGDAGPGGRAPGGAGLALADEISPDSRRFWDPETNEKLDKDRFRRDLGNVKESYAEAYRGRRRGSGMDYRDAGVNIEEGCRAAEKYRELAAGTMNRAVLSGIGGFAGLFSLKELIEAGAGMEEPVLVSGTGGVGTKLDIAFKMEKYDTVGIDCVAMCVNDILCHGAKPLFFLDYLACGKLDAGVAAELVKGAAAGCRESGAVLLGGETAEMPGFYEPGKYDIAGFAVGLADRKRIVDGSGIQEGDVLVGIASSGVHSNGFSLIRRVIPDLHEDFGGMPIGRALLEPARLYVKPVLGLLEEFEIRGMAHITGGGFYENIPRMFNRSGSLNLDAVIESPFGDRAAWTIPPIFNRIAWGVSAGDGLAVGLAGDKAAGFTGNAALSGAAAQAAGAELLKTGGELRRLMFNTFNMGIGFVLALAPGDSGGAVEYLNDRDYPAWEIGRVRAARASTGAVYFV